MTKLITLKSHPSPSPAKAAEEPRDAPVPAGLASLKPVTKVMYTGKRGRPKKVKPGMHDPHQAERRQIEERLMRDYPALANQISKEEEEGEEEGGEEYDEEEYKYGMDGEQPGTSASSEQQELDPSSEAEALSHVASGIAASLGLVEQQYPSGMVVQDGHLVLQPGQPGGEYLQVLGQPGIPLSQPGLPLGQPGLPLAQPGLPLGQPGIPLQYGIKDPRLQGLTMGPDLSLPQGLIPVSTNMFATSPAMLPVSSDHLLPQDMVAGPSILPMVVSTSTMLQQQHIMMQGGQQVLVPASSMMTSTFATSMMTSSPGIMVMSPQALAPPSQGAKEAPPTKVVTKIASDWDSDEDQ